jgi:hypothetical protein
MQKLTPGYTVSLPGYESDHFKVPQLWGALVDS